VTFFPTQTLQVNRYLIGVNKGHYERGHWKEGTSETPFTIKASVQPITGSEMITLSEGRRVKAMYRVFCSTLVYVSDPVENTNRDTITWEGDLWEVIKIEKWKNNIINHIAFVMCRELEGSLNT
jgi:hypothetical protein